MHWADGHVVSGGQGPQEKILLERVGETAGVTKQERSWAIEVEGMEGVN